MKNCRLCGVKIRWWQWLSAYRDNGHVYHGQCWSSAIVTVNLWRQMEHMQKKSDEIVEYQFDRIQNSIATLTNVLHKSILDQTGYLEKLIEESDKDQYAYNKTTLEETRKVLLWLDTFGVKRDDKEYLSMFDPMFVEIILKTTGMSLEELASQVKNKELKRIINNLKKDEHEH
jgi:hypothetical protein